jgi:sugar phosphate isomerase/epimerase
VTVVNRLSLNQATVKRLGVPEAVDLCARHDIAAIGLWREPVAELGVGAAAAAVQAAGLRVSSLCRGGFFTHADPAARAAAIADNKAAIAEAAVLGTGTLVLVSGGLVPGSRDDRRRDRRLGPRRPSARRAAGHRGAAPDVRR